MLGLSIYACVIGIIYCWIQLGLRHSWLQMSSWNIPSDFIPETSVVVIIPARNEAANIKTCLESILNQNYPSSLMKVLLVDDYSEDRTLEVARKVSDNRLTIIALEDLELVESTSPKKRAINIGIQKTTAELIITTDADCIVNENWMLSVVSYFQLNKVDMIAGPVLFEPLRSAFERFQALDFIGMMGVTGAGIYSSKFHMCNGANLAFSRRAFMEVDGYTGTEHVASGDDILLAQKFINNPQLKMAFLKSNDAIVRSKPVEKVSQFISQRLRWGSLSTILKNELFGFSLLF